MSQTRPTLNIIPRKSKLESSKENIVEVLLRVATPEIDTSQVKRPPLNLCVVLDRSGSMGGVKIMEAIAATKMCIDRMEETDIIGLVVFDQTVRTVFPNRRVTDKEVLKEQVDRVFVGGSTALHAAWITGGMEVTVTQDRAAVNRILLITDGQANVGETRPDVLCHQAAQLHKRGVSTTTIGIGSDFNEDLLIPMAEAGGGNAWHVETPESMSRIFDIELNGLVSQFGHTVSLGIKPEEGVQLLDVLNEFDETADGRSKLPNLTAANNLDIVVRLKISPEIASGSKALAEFDVTFVGQQSGIPERVDGIVAVDFVTAEEAAAVTDDLEVEAASVLLTNARDRKLAIESIDRGDMAEAHRIMRSMHDLSGDILRHNGSSVLREELQHVDRELEDLNQADSVMARKKMAFARSMRSRGKWDR